MKKKIYILIVIALFGIASIWITGNVVILILSVLGQLVALLMGNADNVTFKSIGGGGIKRPPSDDDNGGD